MCDAIFIFFASPHSGGGLRCFCHPARRPSMLRWHKSPAACRVRFEPGRDRPPLTAPAQPKFDFRIETPGRSSVPRSVDEIRFRLNGIEVKGAVTLPASQFRGFYQPLIGRDVSLSDILDVAAAIENEYRRAGYILVRAFVPPQRVADGIFTINVVEGFIANVSVEGGRAGTRERIRTYLEPARASRPLQLSTIERALLLSNDLPGVSGRGVLRPSPETPGASELVVTVPDNPANRQFRNRQPGLALLRNLVGNGGCWRSMLCSTTRTSSMPWQRGAGRFPAAAWRRPTSLSSPRGRPGCAC